MSVSRLLSPSRVLNAIKYHALSFDGVDDYVEVPENGIPSGASGEELTVMFWIKPDDISQDRGIIGIDTEWLVSIENGGEIWMRTWGGNNGGTIKKITVGKGYLITAIWKVGVGHEIYVNGEFWDSVDPSNTDTSSDTGNNLMIGQVLDRGALWRNRFNGLIALVRIYNRALTESEIEYIKEHPHNPIIHGLVLWLDIDSVDTVNGVWKDKSGNGNDGTIYGASVVEINKLAGRVLSV